ncbi:response regulator [Pusillimonas noertemannii]|uniref:Response regulator receiver domain-containing protein n=1 Tax=Pusillimonas noertemannii TaxID=305977 RepID=A0A2U1CNH9_9BURK|nr:response regulator [Pusillimonas noertemannii]NYT68489.1 response regulator [Pusillimonas noertemannii]PVY62494.1 response regulator receiver domain-containing protein [Pusillimonas noertemannii]TFL10551.1 response regulator [Pusillimonas noertemannii]
MARILVVDDEIGIRELLSEILYDEGHTVELAENAAEARAARLRRRPDLVLLDIWMPDTDGVSLLKEWASQGLLDMPVIMMSGHATVDTAVEATRIGAVDFLEKPITLQKLLKTIASGLARPMVAPGLVTTMRPPELLDPGAQPLTTVPVPELNQPAPAPVPETGNSLLGGIALDQPLRDARDEFERIYFQYHLGRENHSMTRVSEKTGLERTHLYRKLKQLGIETSRRKNNS